ncbi:hypothetical protein RchiOBHm_Chr6g0261061 [Rosa chinensis]|uniref:Uncharacterized protein n=1 Tax=Rosa chinensis TaxID=74649 RepID=A0A2P6PNC9_ROSCH|nr:hypothetical protein RchiOBHm_Chr6g0261061 [Rosa chinensis]
MGSSPPILHGSGSRLWFSILFQQPRLFLGLGLDGGQDKVVLRDLLPWVVGFHMICVMGFDWHRLFNMELLGVLLLATHQRFYMVGGVRWSAVARFSVMD